MKKNLEVGEGRTRAAGLGLAGVRAAIAGCLMVLAGWAGAGAQNFTAPHGTGTNLNDWTQVDGTTWAVGADGYVTPTGGNGNKFLLIHKNDISNDGIFTVVFNRVANKWLDGSNPVAVFRYQGPSAFYAISLHVGEANWGAMKVNFFNSPSTLQNATPAKSVDLATPPPSDPNYTIMIRMKGSNFDILNKDSTVLGTFSDPDLTYGKVGYGYGNRYDVTGKFVSSQWTSADPVAEAVPSAYSGYYVWNTDIKKTFTGGDGLWSGAFWSKDSSTVKGAWAPGSNALFIASPKGTVTAAAQSVGNMAFAFNGYEIDGTSLALGATNRRITVTGTNAATISSVLSGSGGITKDSSGTLTLSAANTYTGGTTVSAGTVVAAKSGALGDSAGTVRLTAAGATLRLAAAAGTTGITLNNPLTLGGGALSNTAGVNTLGGTIQVSSASTISVDGSLTLKGAISGTAGITKNGNGKLYIEAENTGYTGTTAVNEGELEIRGSLNGGTGGSINLAYADRTVTFNRTTGSATQYGITGPGKLVKEGAGTLILTGNNSGHTGSVTINSGILQVANITSIGPPAVTIAPTGTLRLSTTTFPKNIAGTSSGTGTLEKTGTDTLKLTEATGINDLSLGKVVVTGGVLSVNRSLKADSIRIGTGAQLDLLYTSAMGADGNKIAVNAGGALVVPATASGSVTNKSDVILNGTGMIRNLSGQLLTIDGALTMSATSTIELSLAACSKNTPISVGKTAALNGTFNLKTSTGALTESDIGEYKIIGVTGAIAGTPTVKIDGDEKPSGYIIEKTISDGILKIKITEEDLVDPTTYNLRVASVVPGTQANIVNVTVSGFNNLRKYLTGDPRVTGAYIIYKPGVGATSLIDTTLAGGRIGIPLSDFPTGDTKTITVTVPTTKNISDTLYYFNAGVVWVKDGATTTLAPAPSSDVPNAYLIDPKTKVLSNGFGITVDKTTSETSGVTFELTVTGQSDANLTPSATYKPRVDSVAVWFKKNGTAPAFAGNGNSLNKSTVGADTILVFALSRLRADGKFTFKTGAVPDDKDFDVAFFAVAPRWRGTALGVVFDSLARPIYARSQNVPNPNKNPPNNPIELSYTYQNNDRRQPTISITVSTKDSEPLNDVAEKVRIELAFDQDMSKSINIDNNVFTKAQINAGLPPIEVRNDGFVGETRTVYYRITVSDADGYDVFKDGSFTDIGRDKPKAPENLKFEPLGKGHGLLTWDAVTAVGNNIGNISQSKIDIYYGTGEVSTNGAPKETVSASETEFELSLLEPETEYWFAVVLEDFVNAAKTDWNLRSNPRSITANSGAAYVALNIVKIDTVFFVESNSSFSVVYSLTDDKTGQKLNYDVAFDQAITDSVSSGSNIEIKNSAVGSKDTLSISLGSALKFNTTYWVQLYTVEEDGKPGAGRSVKDVAVGKFTKMEVKIPSNESNGVNGEFILSTKGWPLWNGIVDTLFTTIAVATAPTENDIANEGFKPVGEYGYTVTTKDGGLLYLYDKFTISIANNELPPTGYSYKDIGIYRWNEAKGYWEATFDTKYEDGYFTGTAVDSVKYDGNMTYRLLINTKKPTVSMPDSANDVVDMNGQIISNTDVWSNVGNYQVSMICGPAKGKTKLEPINLNGPEIGKSRHLDFNITSDIVDQSENFGVLAFIKINDGVRDTLVNVSYRVRSKAYGGFPASDLRSKAKWSPFAAQVELLNESVRSVIEPAMFKGSDQPFVPHDTLYRLFRYGKNGWVEFNTKDDPNNDTIFDVKPTRLMWFKSAKGVNFDFGGATSISLRNTYDSIKLPPNQWTDIVLPFRFNICIGDILDATTGGRGNLEFYRWKGGDPRFTAELLNKPGMSDTLELKGETEPFTIFNKSNSTVTLRIPPNPAEPYKAIRRKTTTALAKTLAGAQQETNGAWHYTLRAAADGYELSDVLVGYNATDLTFAVPPSFGNESVVLVGDDGAEIGHHFGPSIANGRTYKLRFYNDGKQQTTFTFSAKASANTPISARVTFVRAATGEILSDGSNATQNITVAGRSHDDVFMIVGANNYRAKAASVSAGAKFNISKIIVNRAARSARINFYVPQSGINQVDVSIYDIKGRQVWKTSQKTKAASWNVVEWNSRNSKWGATSTGLYIVRVKAIGDNGRTAGADTKRIMFSR